MKKNVPVKLYYIKGNSWYGFYTVYSYKVFSHTAKYEGDNDTGFRCMYTPRTNI